MGELTKPAQLRCSIVHADHPPGFSSQNFSYVVTDESGIVVAEGVSSSPSWVRHDAGGFHTKQNFDEKFPQGWCVDFDF